MSKIAIMLFLGCAFHPILAQKKMVDELTGVEIVWEIDSGLFKKGSEFRAVILKASDVPKACSLIVKALRKYPDEVLRKHLKKIYVMDSIKVNGFDWGGTYATDKIYIVYDKDETYTEQGVHHEFSSILFNFYGFFDDKEWERFNPVGFKYSSSGRKAIESNSGSQSVSSRRLCRKGFIYQYSLASIEEDFNCIAENLFRAGPSFWTNIRLHKRLQKKALYVSNFYYSIHPSFEINYFKKISIN